MENKVKKNPAEGSAIMFIIGVAMLVFLLIGGRGGMGKLGEFYTIIAFVLFIFGGIGLAKHFLGNQEQNKKGNDKFNR